MVAARETLGPAEHIINTLLTYQDHLYHGRPGVVRAAPHTAIGVEWVPAVYRDENDQKVVYQLSKRGKKEIRTRLGVLTEAVGNNGNGAIKTMHVRTGPGPRDAIVGEYRRPGIFPEVAVWFYRQIAEVYKLDHEFAARWASYAMAEDHKDLKVLLAAFMLVQARKGDPVVDGGEVVFFDADFRDVGEAMLLMLRKDKKHFTPKMLLRVHDVLTLPEVAQINRELGFGNSARTPFLGRWPKVVTKWLEYREENPKLLEGLVKEGWRTTVMDLARRVHYKPLSPRFFEILRWKQAQAKDGRRQIAIGAAVAAAESWAGKTEREICQLIVAQKPNWKRIVGMLPKDIGVTPAIVAAAMQAGSFSDKDLVIATPTLEELGLLAKPNIRKRWEAATKKATDMRAANIAKNVRSKEVAEQLEQAADAALQKAVEEVTRNMRIYVLVDISGSMHGVIEQAKELCTRFLQGFPLDRMHVVVFNTAGRVVKIPHPSAAGVERAFHGIHAGGGTDYGEGFKVLAREFKPKEDEDLVCICVGDEAASPFAHVIHRLGVKPAAFGLLKVGGGPHHRAVRDTALQLGVPCFQIDPNTFDDVYAIPRTIRRLIQATPVATTLSAAPAAPRVSLVDLILKTELLHKPAWA